MVYPVLVSPILICVLYHRLELGTESLVEGWDGVRRGGRVGRIIQQC